MNDEMKAVIDEGFKSIEKELGATLAKHTEEIEKHGKASTELTGKIDELSGKWKELDDQILELAQRGHKASPEAKGFMTAGREFIDSEAYKAIASGDKERVRFEVKNTVINSNLSALFADSTSVFPYQSPGVVPGDFAPLTVRQLIPTVTVASNAVNTLREVPTTGWNSAAAETAQGAEKPESDLTMEAHNTPIEVVAHWIKVSNQLLADAPAVASYIDTRLRDGLAQRVDLQLIAGNGTTPNLSGLTDSGNFTAFTPASGANLVESINKAKYELWALGNMPDTVIVNPTDWSAMELAREGAGSGMYLYGAPGTNAGTMPFGVNVVLSNHVSAGNFIIGALRSSATIYQRSGAVVEMGYVNDDFTRNLVTLRAEERLGLSVDRPTAIKYGAITV